MKVTPTSHLRAEQNKAFTLDVSGNLANCVLDKNNIATLLLAGVDRLYWSLG